MGGLAKTSTAVSHLLRLSVVALLAAAGAWLRIRGGGVGLATGMLFLLAVCLGATLAVELGMAVLRTPAPTRANWRLVVITTGVLVLALEVGLRFGTTRYTTYRELNGRPYWSNYKPQVRGWFHVYRPGPLRHVKTGYTHTRRVSTLGLTEELLGEKAPGEYRILALGDSFTEGVGTSEQSTWVRVVERRLSERYAPQRIVTLNAGIAGSDPFYAYVLFKERLQPFQPDLVIVAINTSDVADVIVRGGMERFRADGSVAFHEPPSWEWSYAVSYVWRMVVRDVLQFDSQLLRRAERERREGPALDELRSAVEAIESLCRSGGARLLVVAHPGEGDVRRGSYEFGFERLLETLGKDPRFGFVDLLERYREVPITANNASEFFWRTDRHHNARGYEVMGDLIAAEIVRLGLGPREPGPGGPHAHEVTAQEGTP